MSFRPRPINLSAASEKRFANAVATEMERRANLTQPIREPQTHENRLDRLRLELAHVIGKPLHYSLPELQLHNLLWKLKVPFRSHVRMGRYEADVLVSSQNLVIEADGDYWHSRPATKIKDSVRDDWMKAKGYRVLRISETDLKEMTPEELSVRMSNV